MELILEQQVHMAATQTAMQAEHAAPILKTDKRLDGLSKIVKFGMEVVLKQAESIKELRDAQKHTDEKFNALVQVVDDLVRRRLN